MPGSQWKRTFPALPRGLGREHMQTHTSQAQRDISETDLAALIQDKFTPPKTQSPFGIPTLQSKPSVLWIPHLSWAIEQRESLTQNRFWHILTSTSWLLWIISKKILLENPVWLFTGGTYRIGSWENSLFNCLLYQAHSGCYSHLHCSGSINRTQSGHKLYLLSLQAALYCRGV